MARTTRMDSTKTEKRLWSVCIAMFLLAGFCFGQGSGDRTEFHRINMQRFNPFEKTLNVHNVGNLHKKWSYKTGSTVPSSPAVANGVVYVGSYDHNIYAFGLKKGRE
jgi:outer membrane protein assembly factor BamB